MAQLEFDESLNHEESIWRYMSLSAFFMLLEKKQVWVPSLAGLRDDCDPNEGRLPEREDFFPEADCDHHFDQKTDSWLRSKADPDDDAELEGNRIHSEESDTFINDRPILLRIWLREIAKRRCVWCWYLAEEESMSQWSHFGKQGVAIRSKPAKAAGALRLHVNHSMLVTNVRYMPDKADAPPLDAGAAMRRPFLIKPISFGHENEVRFVFTAPESNKGHMIGVEHLNFIEAIHVSPFLHQSEAAAVCAIINQLNPPVDAVPSVERIAGSYRPDLRRRLVGTDARPKPWVFGNWSWPKDQQPDSMKTL